MSLNGSLVPGSLNRIEPLGWGVIINKKRPILISRIYKVNVRDSVLQDGIHIQYCLPGFGFLDPAVVNACAITAREFYGLAQGGEVAPDKGCHRYVFVSDDRFSILNSLVVQNNGYSNAKKQNNKHRKNCGNAKNLLLKF